MHKLINVASYTLDVSGLNWADLLSSWSWLLPREFTVWFANRLGDLFLVFEDGAVWMLDVGMGSLDKKAASRGQFVDLVDISDNGSYWLKSPLVDKLADWPLAPGECYSYVRLPLLGGDFSMSNFRVVKLEWHYKALGAIHEKIRDLPDGTDIVFEVS